MIVIASGSDSTQELCHRSAGRLGGTDSGVQQPDEITTTSRWVAFVLDL